MHESAHGASATAMPRSISSRTVHGMSPSPDRSRSRAGVVMLWRSSRITWWCCCDKRSAAAQPAGPPPITITSADSWRSLESEYAVSVSKWPALFIFQLGWVEEIVRGRGGLSALVNCRGHLVRVEPCDVAGGVDAGDAGQLLAIDCDVAIVAQLYIQLLSQLRLRSCAVLAEQLIQLDSPSCSGKQRLELAILADRRNDLIV